ncbi:MAG: multicopper oxidase domain-containing protein [Candidatus Palauibacterales bacterium]|nr:multicopper oxidase domain-containing protein [Candidatus Palauibacterales bacterium]
MNEPGRPAHGRRFAVVVAFLALLGAAGLSARGGPEAAPPGHIGGPEEPGVEDRPAPDSVNWFCGRPGRRPERDAVEQRAAGGNRDLYCPDLLPTSSAQEASARAQLAPAESPFGVPLTPEGRVRYRVSMRLQDLPPPSSLGEFETYVAWAASPTLRPMVRLGEVGEGGTFRLGTVDLNKFLLLVSAERSSDVRRRQGPIVLRAQSPSMRLQPHDLPYGFMGGGAGDTAEADPPEAGGAASPGVRWRPPRMPAGLSMVPPLRPLRPGTEPFLPVSEVGDEPPPRARPREVARLEDGDTLRLAARRVRRKVGGRTYVMYGFNGQYPGPLIRVARGAEIVVLFENRISHPTTVHWHGLRLENRFDGVPGVTQEPVPPGGSFTYRIRFPDAGIYWYHPHVREDLQQDLGLYGNMLVEPGRDGQGGQRPDAGNETGQGGDPAAGPPAARLPEPEPAGLRSDPAEGDFTYGGHFGPVNREEVLTLDDLLLSGGDLVPWGRGVATNALMGRFGNTFLVNGEPRYRLEVDRGEVVRFYLTNVANTRTFNLSFGDLPTKVVASDLSRFEREARSPNVVLAPAERYVVEVRFDEPGTVPILNRVQAIDHVYGNFFTQVDTLGTVRVREESADESHADAFRTLRSHPDVERGIERYRQAFDGPVDRRLHLTMDARGLPFPVSPLVRKDSTYFHPVEAAGTMPRMNWVTTTRQVRWILRDPDTGRENRGIEWDFRVGELEKIRIRNLRHATHAMQHPIHIHGQRFLVLSRNGEPEENLVWKDTTIIPVGTTATILLELTNPGTWMIHCHIAEHLDAGMQMTFEVEPNS